MSLVKHVTADTKAKFSLYPMLLMVLPPLFWAGNFIVGRASRGLIPPVTLAFDRWVIATLLLLPFAWSGIKKDWRAYYQYKWLILLTSLTGFTAFNTMIYIGLQFTAATNSIILNSFAPLLIMLLGSVFFGIVLKKRQWFGMLVSFSGVLTIVSHGQWHTLASLSFNRGDIIIFLAVVCWAFYTIGIKRMPAHLERKGVLCMQMIIGTVCLAPFYLWERLSGLTPLWNLHSVLSLTYVSIVPSLLAYLLYTACVERFGAAKAGLSIHLLPAFGIVFSLLLLGEHLHLFHIGGILLIFLGILLS